MLGTNELGSREILQDLIILYTQTTFLWDYSFLKIPFMNLSQILSHKKKKVKKEIRPSMFTLVLFVS